MTDTLSSATNFRIATAADAASIVEVVNAAFAIEQFLEGTRTDAERMEKLQTEGQFLVAEEEGGRIVASVYTELRGERGYLGMLAVHPSRQGTGLGRAMMEAGEDHLRRQGCKFADLTVLSLRPELPQIYRGWGYVEIGTDEFRPSRPLRPGIECHCINMAKPL
jgi:ribosomal protein S18 acetylase RimI-like enzyme